MQDAFFQHYNMIQSYSGCTSLFPFHNHFDSFLHMSEILAFLKWAIQFSAIVIFGLKPAFLIEITDKCLTLNIFDTKLCN
jgi:hypothetical protein